MLGTITSHDDDLGPDSEVDEAKAGDDDDKLPVEPPITAKSESDQSKSSEQPKKTIPISEKIDKFAQKNTFCVPSSVDVSVMIQQYLKMPFCL